MLNSTTTSSVEPERVPRLLHVLLVAGSHWAPEIVRALWAWCLASAKPAHAHFVAATAKASNVFGLRDQQACDRLTTHYLQHTLTARFLVEVLEGLHDTGSLSRQEATYLQERILGSTDRHGKWKL